MAFLDDDALDAIAARVFRERTTTLESEGRQIESGDLIGTLSRVRHRMFVTLDGLPDAAFEPRPEDAEGNEVWSAGQIVGHICQSQLRMTESMAGLVDITVEEDTSELAETDTLTRGGARKALIIATRMLRETLRSIPDDADLSRTVDHERFGTLGVLGWLVLSSVHEHGHVRQLRSLEAA